MKIHIRLLPLMTFGLEIPIINEGQSGLSVFDYKANNIKPASIHFTDKTNSVINSVFINYKEDRDVVLNEIDVTYKKYIDDNGIKMNKNERILIINNEPYLVCVWDDYKHIVNIKENGGKYDNRGYAMEYVEGGKDELIRNGSNLVLLGKNYIKEKDGQKYTAYYKESK